MFVSAVPLKFCARFSIIFSAPSVQSLFPWLLQVVLSHFYSCDNTSDYGQISRLKCPSVCVAHADHQLLHPHVCTLLGRLFSLSVEEREGDVLWDDSNTNTGTVSNAEGQALYSCCDKERWVVSRLIFIPGLFARVVWPEQTRQEPLQRHGPRGGQRETCGIAVSAVSRVTIGHPAVGEAGVALSRSFSHV